MIIKEKVSLPVIKNKQLNSASLFTPFILGIFLILGPLFSCSAYIQYLESEQNKKVKRPLLLEKTPQWCSSLRETNIIYEEKNQVKKFQKILRSINSSIKLTLVEKGLLFALFQSMTRPDASNWNARQQFMMKIHGKFHSFDFHSQSQNFPKAVKTLKKLNFSHKTLPSLLKLVKRFFPSKLTVQEKMSQFLKENQHLLTPKLKKKYLRLSKPLQNGESFPYGRIPSLPFVSQEKEEFTPPLFKKENIGPSSQLVCNFDQGLYQSGIFVIRKEYFHENVFALVEPNGDYFIGATSAGAIKKMEEPLYLSQVKIPQFAIPFCRYTDKNKDLLFIGFNSRDSGQLLYHLMNYGIYNASSLFEINEYLSYARHQFLTSPSRLLYESQRGDEKELSSYLSLDFPVYHTKNIGTIYSFISYPPSPKTLFLRDIRSKAGQSCLKEKQQKDYP